MSNEIVSRKAIRMSPEQTHRNAAGGVDGEDDSVQDQADEMVDSGHIATESSSEEAGAEADGSIGARAGNSNSLPTSNAMSSNNGVASAAKQKTHQQIIVTPQKTTASLTKRGGPDGRGRRGVGSAVRNPSMKITTGAGLSKLGRRASWADAARKDDVMGWNPYANFMDASDLGSLGNVENQGDLMDKLLYNKPDAGSTSATGATEEERRARRERIRARQEGKQLNYADTVTGDDGTSMPRYYRAADGSIKKLPNFVREEYLESMKEGGVPIKSWLAIGVTLGVGLYHLCKMLTGPGAGSKKQKNAADAPSSSNKKRSRSKLTGKKGSGGKRVTSTSTSMRSPRSPSDLESMIDFDFDKPEPAPEHKHPKKKTTVAKKKRPKKSISALKHNGSASAVSDIVFSVEDKGGEGEIGSSEASFTVTGAAGASAVTPAPATVATPATFPLSDDPPLPSKSSPDSAFPSEPQLHTYSEDDRIAKTQMLTKKGEDVSYNDGEWRTAERNSKIVKKLKEQPKASALPYSQPDVDRAKEEEKKDEKIASQPQDISATSAGTTDTDTEPNSSDNAGTHTNGAEESAMDECKEDAKDDDSEWQFAGRRRKPVKKPKEHPKTSAITNPRPATSVDNTRVAIPPEQINVATVSDTDTESSATTANNNNKAENIGKGESKEEDVDESGGNKKGEENDKNAAAAESKYEQNNVATAQQLKTKEEDAALARLLQKQEESMAAREKGETIDEIWEEVTKKKNKKRKGAAAAVTPCVAIAAL